MEGKGEMHKSTWLKLKNGMLGNNDFILVYIEFLVLEYRMFICFYHKISHTLKVLVLEKLVWLRECMNFETPSLLQCKAFKFLYDFCPIAFIFILLVLSLYIFCSYNLLFLLLLSKSNFYIFSTTISTKSKSIFFQPTL